MIQPASTTACRMASQLAVVLLAKTIVPMPSGARDAPTIGKGLGQFAFVVGKSCVELLSSCGRSTTISASLGTKFPE